MTHRKRLIRIGRKPFPFFKRMIRMSGMIEGIMKYGTATDTKTGETLTVYDVPIGIIPLEYDVRTPMSAHTALSCLTDLLVNEHGEVVGSRLLGLYRILQFPRDLGYQ